MRGQAKGGHKRLQLICNAFLNNNKKKTKKKTLKKERKLRQVFLNIGSH